MLEGGFAEVKGFGYVAADTGWSPQIAAGTAVMIPESLRPGPPPCLALIAALAI